MIDKKMLVYAVLSLGCLRAPVSPSGLPLTLSALTMPLRVPCIKQISGFRSEPAFPAPRANVLSAGWSYGNR